MLRDANGFAPTTGENGYSARRILRRLQGFFRFQVLDKEHKTYSRHE